jgi:hypothetical protein
MKEKTNTSKESQSISIDYSGFFILNNSKES